MHDQPKYSALESSTFFPDSSSARLPVAGTVARGQLRDDELLYTGKSGGQPVDLFPFAIDDGVMARGREMFDAFCAPCHARTGSGDGLVVRRGFTRPPDLVSERVRALPAGQVFDVITNGFGAMPDHAAQVKVSDRWAIVAYVRALQLSAAVPIAELSPEARAALEP